MKTDDFEKRLQRQTQREIPGTWREEILSAARVASPRLSALDPRPSLLSTLLRPQRAAWAGLVVVWVVIFALNFSVRDNSTSVQARNFTPPSPEALAAWRQQRRELAGLTETSRAREVEGPKNRPPQPRSSRRDETVAV